MASKLVLITSLAGSTVTGIWAPGHACGDCLDKWYEKTPLNYRQVCLRSGLCEQRKAVEPRHPSLFPEWVSGGEMSSAAPAPLTCLPYLLPCVPHLSGALALAIQVSLSLFSYFARAFHHCNGKVTETVCTFSVCPFNVIFRLYTQWKFVPV